MLRTTGHKSGLIREAPPGYTVIDGRIMVVAGYGRSDHVLAVAFPIVAITATAVRPAP